MLRASLLVFLLLTTYAHQAAAYCIESWACVSVKRGSEGVSVKVANARPYPITLTVVGYAENLTDGDDAKKRFVETRVLPGNQQDTLLNLRKYNADVSYWFDYDFHWTPGNMHAQHDSDYRYRRPFAKGQRYPVVQGFGGGYSHTGASRYAVDFAMPVGTPVHAARGGVVIDKQDKHNRGGASRRFARYANFVTILHDDQTTGEYYHLKQHGVAVAIGDRVERGQLIGFSGNTGFSSLPHLHFAVYRAKSHGDYESLPFRFASID